MSRNGAGDVEYKFVETSVVTDEVLERVVNDWVGQGWQLDGIHFVSAPSSKRPVMAFVAFTRVRPLTTPSPESGTAEGAGGGSAPRAEPDGSRTGDRGRT